MLLETWRPTSVDCESHSARMIDDETSSLNSEARFRIRTGSCIIVSTGGVQPQRNVHRRQSMASTRQTCFAESMGVPMAMYFSPHGTSGSFGSHHNSACVHRWLTWYTCDRYDPRAPTQTWQRRGKHKGRTCNNTDTASRTTQRHRCGFRTCGGGAGQCFFRHPYSMLSHSARVASAGRHGVSRSRVPRATCRPQHRGANPVVICRLRVYRGAARVGPQMDRQVSCENVGSR